MAFPLTPLRTYIDGSTRFQADDLNKINSAINALFGGSSSLGGSLKSLLVDGVGAQAVSLAAGIVAKTIGGALQFGGTSGDETKPGFLVDDAPTSFRYCGGFKTAAGVYLRFYSYPGGLYIAYGASWGGSSWTRDTGIVTAFAAIVQGSGFQVAYMTGSSWLQSALINSTSIQMTNGSLSATTTVTAGTGITATTGDIEATAGALKGRHLVGKGGTPTINGVHASIPVAPTIVGTDLSGTITFTTTATIASSAKVFDLNFASAFAAAPVVIFSTQNSPYKFYSSSPGTTKTSCAYWDIPGGSTALPGAPSTWTVDYFVVN